MTAHQVPCPWDSPGKNIGVGGPFPSPVHESEKWKWSYSVMSDSLRSVPIDCSIPGSFIHGIFQARVLEWVAISFSTICNYWRKLSWFRGSSLPHFGQVLYLLSHQGSPRILEWVSFPFSRESSKPRNWTGLLHCSWILCQMSYQGSCKLVRF